MGIFDSSQTTSTTTKLDNWNEDQKGLFKNLTTMAGQKQPTYQGAMSSGVNPYEKNYFDYVSGAQGTLGDTNKSVQGTYNPAYTNTNDYWTTDENMKDYRKYNAGMGEQAQGAYNEMQGAYRSSMSPQDSTNYYKNPNISGYLDATQGAANAYGTVNGTLAGIGNNLVNKQDFTNNQQVGNYFDTASSAQNQFKNLGSSLNNVGNNVAKDINFYNDPNVSNFLNRTSAAPQQYTDISNKLGGVSQNVVNGNSFYQNQNVQEAMKGNSQAAQDYSKLNEGLKTLGMPAYDTSQAGQKYFQDAVLPQLKRSFERDILPQFKEQFSGPQFWSQNRANQTEKLMADTAQNWNSQEADLIYKDELARRQALENAMGRSAQLAPQMAGNIQGGLNALQGNVNMVTGETAAQRQGATDAQNRLLSAAPIMSGNVTSGLNALQGGAGMVAGETAAQRAGASDAQGRLLQANPILGNNIQSGLGAAQGAANMSYQDLMAQRQGATDAANRTLSAASIMANNIAGGINALQGGANLVTGETAAGRAAQENALGRQLSGSTNYLNSLPGMSQALSTGAGMAQKDELDRRQALTDAMNRTLVGSQAINQNLNLGNTMTGSAGSLQRSIDQEKIAGDLQNWLMGGQGNDIANPSTQLAMALMGTSPYAYKTDSNTSGAGIGNAFLSQLMGGAGSSLANSLFTPGAGGATGAGNIINWLKTQGGDMWKSITDLFGDGGGTNG